MPKVGDKKFAYTEEGMDAAEDYAMETGQEVIPTYDAGGRVQHIQGYGDSELKSNIPNEMKEGGKVKYIEVEPGKYERQHEFSKQVEASRERDIKNQAKGIVSGKYKNLDVTNITKSVEAKEREAIRQHKVSKEADKTYKAKNEKAKKRAAGLRGGAALSKRKTSSNFKTKKKYRKRKLY